MPKLVQFLLRNTLIGFGLGVFFVAGLMAFDVNGLRTLMLASDLGGLALFILTFFTGLTFASVQIGVAVMLLADDDEPPLGPPSGVRQIWARIVAWLQPPTRRDMIPVPVKIKPSIRKRPTR